MVTSVITMRTITMRTVVSIWGHLWHAIWMHHRWEAEVWITHVRIHLVVLLWLWWHALRILHLLLLALVLVLLITTVLPVKMAVTFWLFLFLLWDNFSILFLDCFFLCLLSVFDLLVKNIIVSNILYEGSISVIWSGIDKVLGIGRWQWCQLLACILNDIIYLGNSNLLPLFWSVE